MARRAAEGATVLAFDARGEAALSAAGVPHRPMPGGPEAVDTAVRTWTRVWGRLPLVDGKSFRELAEWKGTSLWWMGEAFFRSATQAPGCVRRIETFLRLLDAEKPAEVEAVGLSSRDGTLLSRAATVKGVLFHGATSARPEVAPAAWDWQGRREAWAAAVGRWRRGRAPDVTGRIALMAGPDTAALSTTLAAALGKEAVLVAPADLLVGAPRSAGVAAGEGRARLRELWQRLRTSPGVHESFTHGGVAFFDLATSDLAGLLLARLPAALRLYEGAAEWLTAGRPRALVFAVPSRDDRRTLLAAARAAGVPSIVLRADESDEGERADGGPQPDDVLLGEGASDPEQIRALLAARDRVGEKR